MASPALHELIALSTTLGIQAQRPDGCMPGNYTLMSIGTWAVAYANDWPGNPHYRNAKALDAIVRLGDYNDATTNEKGVSLEGEWDEWRMYAWMEAMAKVEKDLDPARRERWAKKLIGSAASAIETLPEFENFAGQIMNHGIWNFVFLYRAGQRFNRPDYCELAKSYLDRTLDAQTPDGCFVEGESCFEFPGTPTTLYNKVSACAFDMYRGHSGCTRSAAAVERAWRWFYDFLLPDASMPPALDCRTPYTRTWSGMHLPASFTNHPEGRLLAEQYWRELFQQLKTLPTSEHSHAHRITGFDAMQYDKMKPGVEPREPSWGEFNRMTGDEACIRRRHGWAAVLSGITNVEIADSGVGLWVQNRTDCVNLYHRDLGLFIGSSNSLIQPEIATFCLFEGGAMRFQHDRAAIKNTPACDTVLLRYGRNGGAASVDTREAERARITLSIHGEKGKFPNRGPGSTQSLMGARAHLSLRLNPGDVITHAGKRWTLPGDGGEAITLSVRVGESIQFAKWKLVCDVPFDFRWPIRTADPYSLFAPKEWIGQVEVVLWPTCWSGSERGKIGRVTANFDVILGG